MDRKLQKESIDRIRKVLLESWDPMEVQDSPDAFDEYDDYAVNIASLLAQGAKEAQIINYLSEVESELMGLDEPSRDDLAPVAKQLLALRVGS